MTIWVLKYCDGTYTGLSYHSSRKVALCAGATWKKAAENPGEVTYTVNGYPLTCTQMGILRFLNTYTPTD
jgi:hypothetical protein